MRAIPQIAYLFSMLTAGYGLTQSTLKGESGTIGTRAAPVFPRSHAFLSPDTTGDGRSEVSIVEVLPEPMNEMM
jgi:hypothetical protein